MNPEEVEEFRHQSPVNEVNIHVNVYLVKGCG